MAALTGVLLTALPALGQGVADMQLFAPGETSTYGGGVRPNEGFFFTADYLRMSISASDGAPVGFPSNGRQVWYGPYSHDMAIQTNSLSTDSFTQQWHGGHRLEMGDRWGHHGWHLGGMWLKSHGQEIVASGANMVWEDPPFGLHSHKLLQGYYTLPGSEFPSDVPPEDRIIIVGEDEDDQVLAVLRDLPVTFDDLIAESRVETWGIEWMYTYRLHSNPRGGLFEIYVGARYLEFQDMLSITGQNDVNDEDDDDEEPLVFAGPGASLADSDWFTDAENNIVGPQVGLRWFRTCDRWTLDASGRFFAGFNNQNIYQKGTLGSRLTPGFTYAEDDEGTAGEGRPLLMSPTSFTNSKHASEFSPVVELRVNLNYQLTRAIGVRAGWTGIWMDGIARADALNVYKVPNMGISMANNRQDVFMHGFNFGVLVNY